MYLLYVCACAVDTCVHVHRGHRRTLCVLLYPSPLVPKIQGLLLKLELSWWPASSAILLSPFHPNAWLFIWVLGSELRSLRSCIKCSYPMSRLSGPLTQPLLLVRTFSPVLCSSSSTTLWIPAAMLLVLWFCFLAAWPIFVVAWFLTSVFLAVS